MANNALDRKTKSPPTWTCPPIRPLTTEESEQAAAIYSSMARVNSHPNGPGGVAGLELQVTLMLLESDSRAKPADNNYWDTKCQMLLVRPAIEPIACSYWKRFGTFDLDDKVALIIASTLAGRPLVYRMGPATGRAAHGDVTFEAHDVATQWLAKIAAATKRPELLAALPMYAFAQTIMSHPFSDGNGRFARLMVHAALAKCAGLRRPEIALAPAFYRRANALGAAVTALSESRDWQPFNAVFLSILEDALALTRAFHRQRRGGR